MERVDRRERTGATWRDLEQAKVVAQMHEVTNVEFINEDATVGEFLDPTTWAMDHVRLPFDHAPGRKGRLIKHDDAWLALPFMAVDEPETLEE